MTIESDLEQSMNEEASASIDYRRRATSAHANGDEVSARLWEHIAEEEDGHYNEFKDRLNSLYESLPRYTGKEALRRIERLGPTGVFLEVSGVVVTVTDTGDTGLTVGGIISAEEFDRQNKTMETLGKRRALGEYHY